MKTISISVNLNESMATYQHKSSMNASKESYVASGAVIINLAYETDFPGGKDWFIDGAVGESRKFQNQSVVPDRVLPTKVFLDVPGIVLYRVVEDLVEQFTIPISNITGIYYSVGKKK